MAEIEEPGSDPAGRSGAAHARLRQALASRPGWRSLPPQYLPAVGEWRAAAYDARGGGSASRVDSPRCSSPRTPSAERTDSRPTSGTAGASPARVGAQARAMPGSQTVPWRELHDCVAAVEHVAGRLGPAEVARERDATGGIPTRKTPDTRLVAAARPR